ncbi:FAD:protein FMN transferase [Pseudomonadota bacterium]
MPIFHRFQFLILCAVVLLVTACGHSDAEYNQRLYVFGTLVDLKVRGVDEQQADEGIKAVDAEFQRMHQDWHAWKPGGELSALNSSFAAGEPLPISDFLLPLITLSQPLYRQSEGMFNPAIGKLIGLWGFHSDEPPGGPPPAAEAIEELVTQAPGMDDLEIENGGIRSRNPALELDFGGFAKGYALDLAIQRLGEFGINNAIVNAGGDLCASGSHGDRPWRIGVRHPQGQGVLAAVDVADGECVLTSGNYERYREHEGIRYAHIIDPRDGQPVRHIASATVIDRDGGVADGAATALTVAGPEHWFRIAKRMGLKFVMLVDEAGTVYMNPAMEQRIEFQGERPQRIQISDPL